MNFEELDKLRLKARKSIILGFLIGALVFIIGLVIINTLDGNDTEASFEVALVIGIIIGGCVSARGFIIFNKLKKDFKLKYIKPLVEQKYPNLKYNPERGLSEEFVEDLKLYKKADRFHSEDMLSGELDGVSFVTSDVKLEERHVQHTKNGTRVYYVTYFQGRIFRYEFNKPFKDTILITESQRPSAYSSLNKVELESMEYNKKFKTYCNEQINAFYVLTPPLILAFLELEKQNPGVISVVINSNYLYIGINNRRDTFELQLNRKIDESMLEYHMQDVRVTENIVNELKLNRSIFKDIASDLENQ